MIYGSWNIRCDRQKFLTFWAIFCPFSPLTTWKIKILTLKKTPGDIIILHIWTINDNHMMYGSLDMERERHDFCHFGPFFALFIPPPLWTQKINFQKNGKNTWRYNHFTNINNSHDVWFLRYGVQQTEFFVILDHFLPFYPPPLTTQKIKILENWKQHVEILSFYTCVPLMKTIWCMVPELSSATDRIFCHFGLFFALLSP